MCTGECVNKYLTFRNSRCFIRGKGFAAHLWPYLSVSEGEWCACPRERPNRPIGVRVVWVFSLFELDWLLKFQILEGKFGGKLPWLLIGSSWGRWLPPLCEAVGINTTFCVVNFVLTAV